MFVRPVAGIAFISAIFRAGTARAAESDYQGGLASPAGGAISSRWTVAADTSVQSIDGSDPGSSFGIGLTYQSTQTEITMIVRKGVSDTISENLGQFILAPASAKLGATMRLQLYAGAPKKCVASGDEAAAKAAGGACHMQGAQLVPNLARIGVYASVDVGTSPYELVFDGVTASGTVTAAAITGAVAWRIEDTLGDAAAPRPVALMTYLGLTLRGSDVGRNVAELALNERAKTHWGLELGALVRIANFDLVAKVTWLNGDATGVSELKFVPSVLFQLPFDVVTTKPQTAPQ